MTNLPTAHLDRFDREAEAEANAIRHIRRFIPSGPTGKEGKRDHGKAARPVAHGGSTRWGTYRLQRVA